MSAKNVLQIAREYLPGWSDDDLDAVLWEETGYPCFWRGDPEDSLRLQLAKFVSREFFGEYGYFDSEKDLRLFAEEEHAREARSAVHTDTADDAARRMPSVLTSMPPDVYLPATRRPEGEA